MIETLEGTDGVVIASAVTSIDAPPASATGPAANVHRRRFHWFVALRRGRGLVGLILILVVLAAGVLAPVLAPYDPTEQIRGANLLGPGRTHWFGTDEVNRDVFSRVLYGIRVAVVVLFVAVPVGALIGVLLGVASSMVRAVDVGFQRLFDVLLAFPAIILAIGITAISGAGIGPILITVIFVEIPVFGRLVRSSILKVRELPFVQSAEVIGASRWSVMRKHILPNAAEPLYVQLALSMSVAIFLESAISFLGIGVRPPEPSLGNILADSIGYLDANYMFAVGPLIVIAILVLAFQLIAQAIGAQRRS